MCPVGCAVVDNLLVAAHVHVEARVKHGLAEVVDQQERPEPVLEVLVSTGSRLSIAFMIPWSSSIRALAVVQAASSASSSSNTAVSVSISFSAEAGGDHGYP